MEARKSAERYTPQWVWYKSLWFLGDQLLQKKMKQPASSVKLPKGVIKSEHLDNSKDSVYDDSDTEAIYPHASVTVYSTSGESRTNDSNESNGKSLIDDSIELSGKRKPQVPCSGEIRSKKRKCTDNCPGNDDTYHFLMSLLTPLRILPYDRSMMVRLKIQNIVTEEVAKLSGTHISCSVDIDIGRNRDGESIPMLPSEVNMSERDTKETL